MLVKSIEHLDKECVLDLMPIIQVFHKDNCLLLTAQMVGKCIGYFEKDTLIDLMTELLPITKNPGAQILAKAIEHNKYAAHMLLGHIKKWCELEIIFKEDNDKRQVGMPLVP